MGRYEFHRHAWLQRGRGGPSSTPRHLSIKSIAARAEAQLGHSGNVGHRSIEIVGGLTFPTIKVGLQGNVERIRGSRSPEYVERRSIVT